MLSGTFTMPLLMIAISMMTKGMQFGRISAMRSPVTAPAAQKAPASALAMRSASPNVTLPLSSMSAVLSGTSRAGSSSSRANPMPGGVTKVGAASLTSGLPSKQRDAGRTRLKPGPALTMREADARILDLPPFRLSPQLPHNLADLRDTRGAERMALAQ